ncbi:copper resistance CopC family protein [Hyphococcus sp.]|jgi:methionine-rich copper-binding protein CopC|uniref:copper resistance CopC family protein n=1 Tax=Hyphococcus sp. TaxID=2038636 RepID=UPI003D13BBF8
MKKALAISIMLMFAGMPAKAHVMIKSSNIEHGGIYDAAPKNPVPENLEFAFNGDVGLVDIRLETSTGESIELEYVKPKEFQTVFVIPLPSLGSGSYVFYWRAIAKDGHALSGKIEFSVR